ncbi:hypothetical protein [Arthrobacter sp. B0490]|uniref:hypothetical protein n=1 Tax=Arthrobacter sp. B0490 TaxID=2058891 RepID=UPI000CE44030|nr:hypothetical protein [Arthrobacter sp. B0490]
MTAHKRRSLSTTLRLSLLTGVGALGWMAVGASGAAAVETPRDAGLLDSVAGVVEPAGTPAVSALTDPRPLLPDLPVVPELAAHVPQLLGQPAGTVLVPVTSAVDELVVQIPVIHDLIPAGTVTQVTSPVVGVVDGTVGGVTEPVLDIVTPVTEPLAPVLDAVPVPDVVAPVPNVVGPVQDVAAPVVDAVSGPAVAPVSGGDTAVDLSDDGSGVAAVPTTSRPVAPASSDVSPEPATRGANLASVTLMPAVGGIVDAVVPARAGVALVAADLPDLPGTPFAAFSTVLASMTSSGSAAPLAALAAAGLLVFILVSGRACRSAAAGLPTSPSYDPGSSPD